MCYAWLGHMKLCEQRELLLSSLGRVVGGRSHPKLLIFSKADRGKALSCPTSMHFKNRTEWGTPQFSKVMWDFGVSSAYQLPSQKFAEQFASEQSSWGPFHGFAASCSHTWVPVVFGKLW